MSRRLRIIGGGLTGILAAFEGHRLGWRDIVLHERFEGLGGVARPRVAHGAELRDGCVYFGGPGDPIVTILTTHGAKFEAFANRFGSVSPSTTGATIFCRDFGGPVVETEETALASVGGASLADRLSAYPEPVRGSLERYCRWHLDDAGLAGIDAEAAIPLAINRVVPAYADFDALADAKRADPRMDDLWGIPRGHWGRTANLVASLPTGGFATLFETCRRALLDLGVRLETESLVPPRQAFAELGDDDTLVWAASPTPLFKPLGLATPHLLRKTFASYIYEARFDGPCPAYVQNFTAQGSAFRVYVYVTGGRTMAVAECVREADPLDLKAEMADLMAGLGALEVGELAQVSVQPRWIYHSREAVDGLAALRAAAAARFGPRFIAGAWEPYAKSAKLAQVNAALAAAWTGESALALTA
ncbi:NAD(P)-binding protein [Caulobacter mirabilis]|uniref:Flagellin modification protein FlmF n=1 Tax=Caulobacter mirabilis TaxID=69666 RepID=A0A2D2AU79_9CAUL|nr:FAD/NAD(P)-binding protein [Caulobacter mirabilis]ATQ41556.1 flagellin modification protein FlmF [Caulobacter mirabilis]